MPTSKLSTLYYEIGLNVPANTPANNPATTVGNVNYPPLYLPAGQIVGLLVTVPTGANNAVFFRLKLNGSIIFPTSGNQSGWSNLTNVVAQYIPFTQPIGTYNSELDLEAYNVSTTNSYLIVIGVIMEV